MLNGQCLQVLGAKRKTLAGFSTATAQPHQGFIYNSDVIQQTPPALRGKASRMVGAKCTLLARMDAYGQDPSGQAGENMKVHTLLCQLACQFGLTLPQQMTYVNDSWQPVDYYATYNRSGFDRLPCFSKV